MKYTACPLYGIQSKKMLKYILHIKNEDLLKQERVASMISPYVDRSKKPRLIEPPQAELKAVQKRIKTLLGKIEVPNNVFLVLREDLTQIMPSCIWEIVLEIYIKLI